MRTLEQIALRLRQLRKKSGLTQRQAASLAGYTEKQVRSAETEGTDSLLLIMDLCHVYGVELIDTVFHRKTILRAALRKISPEARKVILLAASVIDDLDD